MEKFNSGLKGAPGYDTYTGKTAANLMTICDLHPSCQKIDTRHEIYNHKKSKCDYLLCDCPNGKFCGKKNIFKKDMKNHLDEECPYRYFFGSVVG